jgi:hypothetical protein
MRRPPAWLLVVGASVAIARCGRECAPDVPPTQDGEAIADACDRASAVILRPTY